MVERDPGEERHNAGLTERGEDSGDAVVPHLLLQAEERTAIDPFNKTERDV